MKLLERETTTESIMVSDGRVKSLAPVSWTSRKKRRGRQNATYINDDNSRDNVSVTSFCVYGVVVGRLACGQLSVSTADSRLAALRGDAIQ